MIGVSKKTMDKVLWVLANSKEPCPGRKLADWTGLSQGTCRAVCKILVDQGRAKYVHVPVSRGPGISPGKARAHYLVDKEIEHD